MKVLHLTYSDHFGGANIAAYRLHKCLESKISSRMLVYNKKKNEKNIIKFIDKKIISIKFKNYLIKFLDLLFKNNLSNSYNIFNSGIIDDINKLESDIVHMHWVNNELISIEEISKINKPIVWTFHDMWPMCGTEHYTKTSRYISGYSHKNKNFLGFDFEKYIWNLKKKYFSKKLFVITPSLWMKKKIFKSYIFKKKNIFLIRNPINTRLWKPDLSKIKKKDSIKLLFCGTNFISDSRKGFYNLIKNLNELSKDCNFELYTIGDKIPQNLNYNFIIKELTYTDNEKKLVSYFNKCDALLLPSISDNFPNVGIEALSVGMPIISLKNNGITEVIKDKKNGLLFSSFSKKNLKQALDWLKKVRSNKYAKKKIHENISKQVCYDAISKQMINLYSKILNG
jgi:glycosyltransferase involved in cell wall biosynthesis